MRAITQSFSRESYPAVAAGATVQYSATLIDQDNQLIGAADIDSFTLSVVDTKTGDIINSVDDTNILNLDRGTVDDKGNVRVILMPEDTLLDSGVKRAVRSIVLKWSYSGGKRGRHQVDFRIEALAD